MRKLFLSPQEFPDHLNALVPRSISQWDVIQTNGDWNNLDSARGDSYNVDAELGQMANFRIGGRLDSVACLPGKFTLRQRSSLNLKIASASY